MISIQPDIVKIDDPSIYPAPPNNLAGRSYKDIKNSIYLRMMCGEYKEILQFIPHVMVEDMAAIFYYCEDPKEEEDRFWEKYPIISYSHLELWGISQETLFNNSLENTERDFPPVMDTLMNRIVKLRYGDSAGFEEEKPQIYVLTNAKIYLGAAVILYPGLLEKAAGRIGQSYYLIPSSIHEILLIPEDEMIDTDAMQEIVHGVNKSDFIVRGEVLSDHVYYYDTGAGELRTA